MKKITTEDLRRMEGREGLILQGCGGDIQEWVDGINGLLTTEGILLNGSRFENVSVFQHGELTNQLFPFEGVELNAGRLAVWRLRTHEQFGGTWLSSSQSPLNFVSALRRKLRSLPCSSSPHRNRFAGLRRGPRIVPNQLGGFEQEQKAAKPDCPLIGEDGNIFNLIAAASRTLQQNGLQEQAEEMRERIMGGECSSYHAALHVIGEHVNITSPEEQEHEMGGMRFE